MLKVLDKTSMFNSEEIESALINKTLFEVYEALEECGYNPVNQFTGYLLTGDLSYITNYKKSREKLKSIGKAKITSVLIEGYFLR